MIWGSGKAPIRIQWKCWHHAPAHWFDDGNDGDMIPTTSMIHVVTRDGKSFHECVACGHTWKRR